MDTLVAKYSRPAFQRNEPFSDQDELDAGDSVPSLSLRFAMPPVAHVCPSLWPLPGCRDGGVCGDRWESVTRFPPNRPQLLSLDPMS